MFDIRATVKKKQKVCLFINLYNNFQFFSLLIAASIIYYSCENYSLLALKNRLKIIKFILNSYI